MFSNLYLFINTYLFISFLTRFQALGGKAAYSSDKALKEGNIKARLFQCNNKTGMFRVFEIFDFTQDDLDDDDIMLLDTYNGTNDFLSSFVDVSILFSSFICNYFLHHVFILQKFLFGSVVLPRRKRVLSNSLLKLLWST